MSRAIKRVLVVFFILTTFQASAQEQVQMADGLRAEGKIYVVVAMILVILVGFIVYLVLLDRKISRLEKQLPGKNPLP